MKRIWERFSRREKSLLGLTFLVFLLVLGRYFLISPFLERRAWVKSQLEIQPRLLESGLRYLGQKQVMEAKLKKAREQLRIAEASLLSGPTPSLSASELQQVVHAVAVEVGVQVISTRVLNPEAMGSHARIPIQVEVTGQIDQVANLIARIESVEKLLVVEELNIRSVFNRAAMIRGRAAGPIAAAYLRASVHISGLARKEGPSDRTKKSEIPSRGDRGEE